MAALLGSWFTPSFGWQIMFFIAGIPLFLLPVIWKFLPESLAFIVKENKQDKARSIVRRLAPNLAVSESTTFSLPKVDVPESANVVSLFRWRPRSQHASILAGVLHLLVDHGCTEQLAAETDDGCRLFHG